MKDIELISKETVRRIIDSPRTKEQMLRMLESMPPVQHDHIADVSKMVNRDLISRREALEELKALEEKPKALEDDYDFGRRQMLETCIDIIQDLQPSPSAQSEQ